MASYRHAPEGYDCPFCRIADGTHPDASPNVFYRDRHVYAIISKHWWPNNPGHVLIIPNDHYENIYDLPFELSDSVHRFEKCVAFALKAAYQCEGVSSRQHNEPAGYQDVWHYHLHVFPRYAGPLGRRGGWGRSKRLSRSGRRCGSVGGGRCRSWRVG